MQLLQNTPAFDVESAIATAQEHFGLYVSARELPSERDQNFLLTDASGGRFVLKIANALESRELLEAQNAMLSHLANKISFCPRVVSDVKVKSNHFMRLMTYLPGVPLAEVNPHSPELLRDLGRKLGQLDRALADFDHPAVHRDFHWDLANGNRVISEYGQLIEDTDLRETVLDCRFELKTDLRRSVIHGDANDYNVLVESDRVTGLIDFGDIVYSWTVGELAIALAYVMLGKHDPRAAAADVIDGYTEECEVVDQDVLWKLVRLRLAMSVCIAAHQQRQRPENEYLRISQRAIADALLKHE
ncbi:MAG TPA: phosphotransferase [Pyrinomonadaceae bacterium]|nr:phosphotransferase [Pyrinomonadaceae bacterium]